MEGQLIAGTVLNSKQGSPKANKRRRDRFFAVLLSAPMVAILPMVAVLLLAAAGLATTALATGQAHFNVAGYPSPSTAGDPQNFTVQAIDSSDAIDTSYAGTVHFTSSDPGASLPSDYTFVASDNGEHTFSATLTTAGAQSMTATEGAITGTQSGISITHGVATQLVFTSGPTLATADDVTGLTVTVEDAYGNTVIDGTGSATPIGLTLSGGNTTTIAGYGGSATPTNGVATFSGLSVRKVGTSYVLHASNGSQVGASAAFNITPGHLDHFIWTAFTSPRTAGAPFGVSATAYDAYDNVKTDYLGSGASLTSNLADSPIGIHPTVLGNLNWSLVPGVGSANIIATNATVTDLSAGVNQNLTITSSAGEGSKTATTGDFAVTPNTVTKLTFSGQPIDTQVSTPIYSVCAPPPTSSTKPCADLTGTAPLSSPVTVYAVDNWGNPVLSNGIDVTASPNALVGGTKTASTLLGYASFSNLLSEAVTGTGIKLTAKAQANPTVAKVDSNPFRIVTTLKGCTGATCINKALGDSHSNTYVNSWSQITTTSCFYCGTTNVLQSTQLVTTSTASQCNNTVWISDIADQRVTGTNTDVTSTGRALIVIPKATLKASGVTSRGTPSFNICFGAIWIGTGSPTQGWLGKQSATNNTPTRATMELDPNVVPQGQRWYGIPANCGTAGLSSSDPCILLRTKQKADVQSLLGADAASIMKDGDLGIVVRVGGSWDGSNHPF
jgi:hypothetical protein